jgi:hypothetical protein
MPANTTTAISSDDLGNLLEYAERFAADREPVDGECWRLITKLRPSSTEPAVAAREAGSAVSAVPSMNSDVRDALRFALWHHLGSWSSIGQPLRRVLRLGAHERLNDEHLAGARRVQAALSSPATVHAIASIEGAFHRLNSILDAAGSLEAEATQRAVCELRLQIARAQGDQERIRGAEEMLAQLDKQAAGKTVRFVVDADRASGGYVAFSVNERSLEKIKSLVSVTSINQKNDWPLRRADCGSDGELNLSVEWGSDVITLAPAKPICERDGPCQICAWPGDRVQIRSAVPDGWPRPREPVTRMSAYVNVFTELQTGFEESEDGEVIFLTDNREVHELYARDHAGDAGQDDGSAAIERQRG